MLKDLGHLDAAGGLIASPRFDEAMAAYNKALTLDPKLAEAISGAAGSICCAATGRPALPDYEHREKVGEPAFAALPQPRWDGAPLAGERLVLVTEQGLGDTIQFSRFAPLLAARGFDVTILTRKAMAPLLSTLNGVTIETDDDKVAKEPKRCAGCRC